MTKLPLTAAALALAACSSGPDMRPADLMEQVTAKVRDD